MTTATATRERPILFSEPMVRAILAGRKTQTRRIVKTQPETYQGESGVQFEYPGWHGSLGAARFAAEYCKFGRIGDRLWVKEGLWCYDHTGWGRNGQLLWPKEPRDPKDWIDGNCEYEADNPFPMNEPIGRLNKMFMPRWASRITLEITDVRVERLNEISEEDAIAEGFLYPAAARHEDPIRWFRLLWLSIHGHGSWEANPWVWVVEFRRMTPDLLSPAT
jgi:hypothetical protein